MTSSSRTLVLASTSSYRAQLLQRLGVAFERMAPDVDETARAGESAQALSARLAQEKALAVAKRVKNALVIGSDQVLAHKDQMLGKPGSHARARSQLQQLSGQSVQFYTAVCVVDSQTQRAQSALSVVTVRFRALTDDMIERYLDIEKPFDCAGSAKSEGLGIVLLESVSSTDPTALIGLPLIQLVDLLQKFGYSVLAAAKAA